MPAPLTLRELLALNWELFDALDQDDDERIVQALDRLHVRVMPARPMAERPKVGSA
jgi:hypothetical protein